MPSALALEPQGDVPARPRTLRIFLKRLLTNFSLSVLLIRFCKDYSNASEV